MRVLVSLAVCLTAAFLLLVLSTAVCYLSDDVAVPKQLAADWNAGSIQSLILAGEFWADFPRLPAANALIHMPTLLFTGLLLALMLFIAAFKTQFSPLTIALLTMLVGLVPYAIARWALADPTLNAEQAARWLPVMLMGLFYATAVCLVLAILDFLEVAFRTIFFRLTHPRAKLKSKPA
jgi:hypothetical protein